MHRATGGRGEFVLKLDKRLPQSDVAAITARLREHPELAYAVPDRIARVQLTPNDPRFADQWNLSAAEGINAPGAWDITTGSAVTVAVLDTGVLPHADLAGRILPGYDFVSDADRANDGDGRDADATDPGDWVTSAEASAPDGPFEGCPVTNSHWHGTAIAGIIAAAGNNAQGIAGINWLAKILPVRVIGKCGGYTSDIVDGIRWAAGIPVPGVPDNTNPARVINLSMATPGACDVTWQSAINEVWARNVVVVVAAGNSAQNAALFSPASCYNTITVAAVDRNGGLAAYSNTGEMVNFSAPGGVGIGADGIVSTSDNGAEGPANDNAYLSGQGTSLAAAHVSGVASLILSLKPAMTPRQVESLLRSTARAFPADAAARGSFANCAQATCGAGIVDARRAALAAAPFAAITPRLAASAHESLVSRSDGTVWSWGWSRSPELMRNMTSLSGVSGGWNHFILLRSDGTAWARGDNTYGQLGDGSADFRSEPVRIEALTEVVEVAAGPYHSLALKPDGTVWAWGQNGEGQLGDGTTTNRVAPVQVAGLSGVIAIGAGTRHSLALSSDGTVWVWGNDGAQSGSLPVQVEGLAAVIALAAGNRFSLVLKSDGTVWSWGQNDSGQLGDGTTASRQTPVQVSGLSGVIAVSASKTPFSNVAKFALALKSDGTVWAWGSNQYGQLGDGSFDPVNANPRLVPEPVSGITGVTAIVAGDSHSLVLKADGSLFAWGRNGSAQLGDGTTVDRGTPVQVIWGTKDSEYFITMGRDNAVALRSDGTLYFWGDLIDSPFPVLMSRAGPIVGAAAGEVHFLLLSEGKILAVGGNSYGQLGDGSTEDRWTTVRLSGMDNVLAIAAGTHHSLALKSDGSVWAWGRNDSGQLGDGGFTNRSAPAQITGLSGVIAIAAGDAHSLALKSDGTVWVWGNDGAQSGALPVQVEGLAAVTAVTAGNRFSLAVKSDGTLWAWGQNDSGQLGDGSTSHRAAPVQVSGLSGVVAAAAGGGEDPTKGFALALKADGTVWAWGSNQFGQLGDGTFDPTNVNPRLVPGQVIGISGASAIAAGAASALAFVRNVALWAWGRNNRGQLGDGTYTDRSTPVLAEGAVGQFNAGVSDPLAFAAKTDVPVNSVQVSNALNIVGIEDGTPISIAGGEYSINGGAFTSDAGTINSGDAVRVRLTASSAHSATTVATLTIAGIDRTFSVTTLAADTLPLSFGFTTQWNVALGEQAVSNEIVVSGINAPTPISVTGGQYSVNDGPYTDAAGTVNDGDTVTLRLPASSAYATSAATRLTIGGTSAEFMTTTLPSPHFATQPRVEVGLNHSVILRSEGTAWAVGGNSSGELGDGTKETRQWPVRMTNIGDAVGVAAGSGYSLMLRSDGTVWAVGGNQSGQLGDGSWVDQSEPVQVQGLTGAVAVAAGMHSMALKSDGTVWAWGVNNDGQLGDGSVKNRSVPVQVSGLSGVIAIAAGTLHSLALRSDGTVWAWGWNLFGTLGDGSFTNRSTPVQVSGLAGAVAIAGGSLHSLALKSDGTVWAWGENLTGQLGDGTSETRPTPVQVSGFTGAIAIATGKFHGLALKSDGSVWAWGSNQFGQLGDGTFDLTDENPRRVPGQVSGIGGASAIAAGGSSSMVLKPDGSVWAWGGDRASPTQVLGAGGVGHFDAGLSDPLAFAAKTDVPVNTVQVSNAVNIVGIDEGTPISIAGGEYSINGGAFTASQGTINNADAVRVRLTASSGYGATTVATLTIGGAVRSFSVTTYAADLLPLSFKFTAQWNVALGQQAVSNDITVSGINAPTPISVTGGEYSVNGGPYSAAAGAVNNGDAVRLRQAGSSAYATSASARLTIGAVSGEFVATTLPSPTFTTPPRIVVGSNHTVILRSDGTVWGLGGNESGQLGDGTQENRQGPVRMSGIGAVIGVAVGYRHSLMLRSDGTVWAVGKNQLGQLGDGSVLDQSTPVQVQGLAGVVAIAAGTDHSLALKSDGTVWAWGFDFFGELGDGTTGGLNAMRLTPVQVVGLGGVIAIAAGSHHSLALKSDGTVWEWGNDGTLSSLIAVPIDGLSGISAVVAGTDFSIALKSDRTLWAWGKNDSGQLGDGTTSRRATPAQVSGLSGVVAAAASRGYGLGSGLPASFALALKSDGTLWAWGSNHFGQLADGTFDPANSHPRLVPGQVMSISGLSAIAAGDASVVVSKADGSLYAWGSRGWDTTINSPRQMIGDGGDGFFYIENAPRGFNFLPRREVEPGTVATSNTVVLSGLFAPAQASVAGGEISVNAGPFGAGPFTVTNGDTLQVRVIAAPGYSAPATATVTVGVLSQPFTVTTRRDPSAPAVTPQLGAGDSHSAILTSEGIVWNWGYGGNGQLGNGSTVSSSRAFAVSGLMGITQIAVGGFHTLALGSDGTVSSWGWNGAGQLGDGSGENSRRIAVKVAGVGGAAWLSGIIAIAAGGSHSLALKSGGTVWAWGNNGYGQLGDGTLTMKTTPVQVAGLTDVTMIAAGERHSFAIKSDGTLWAWGANEVGQLGDGTDENRSSPALISSINGIIAIAGGRAHTVALRSDGSVWAWGANNQGQLGIGQTASANKPLPTQVGLLAAGIIQIAAGADHSLALRSDGALFAWGSNANRQLGQNDEAPRSLPTEAGLFTGIVRIAAGARHSMAMKADGTLYVFGDNTFGQLRNRSGNYAVQSASLNILRGDVDVSAVLPTQVSALGEANSGGSSTSREPRSLVEHGVVPAGTQSEPKTITVGPMEAGAVQIASVVLEPPNPAFTIASNTCTGTIAQGASCTINTRFSPSAAGTSHTFVKITYADVLGGADFVPLQGKGVAGTSAPALSLSAPALVFGAQTQGTTSATQTLTLTSSGTQPLAISGITVSGDFAQAHDCPATLSVDASCSVQVSFTPTAGGIRSGVLTIVSDASSGASALNLSGTGVGLAAQLSVRTAGGGTVSSSPSGIDCGADCTESYAIGANVTLTATAGAGSSFASWSGACTGNASTCTLTMDANRSVAASFVDGQAPTAPTGLSASAVGSSQVNLNWSAATDNVEVTQYKLYRSGTLIQTLSGTALSFIDTGLAPSTAYSYTLQACDAAGYCSGESSALSVTTHEAGVSSFTPVLEANWNLLGNPHDTPLDVAAIFGNQDSPVEGVTANVVSIWKWNASKQRWAFYSPQLSVFVIKAYAMRRNWEVLTTISPGEGYWVHATSAIALPVRSGLDVEWTPDSFAQLPSEWNLIATASNLTPSAFNKQVSAMPASQGVVPTDAFSRLWAWDAEAQNWYFYSPLFEAAGGLAEVKTQAEGHGYLDFTTQNKTLGLGVGFWVYRP